MPGLGHTLVRCTLRGGGRHLPPVHLQNRNRRIDLARPAVNATMTPDNGTLLGESVDPHQTPRLHCATSSRFATVDVDSTTGPFQLVEFGGIEVVGKSSVPHGVIAMDEQFILRVPPSVAEQIERLMNESAAGSSSNPEDASLDLSFSDDGRSGTFMIGNQSFPASLLDLPTVVESYKTYDDSFLVKAADIGQMVMVREDVDPAPEEVEYKHGLTPPMRDARRRRYRREPDLNAELVHRVEKDLISIMHGVSVSILLVQGGEGGGGEGGDRKKAAPAPAPKPDAQEPAANGEEAEPERSDSDDSEN
ncbi:Transcription initiation factor TFIID subunit 7 [Triticum urartu]|uniref:Transcription initiation factor TFIID subunit 7 n=1 Tax=Triticum urartu TaxID=4572 RepID=M7ZRN4_TRIUA|nr:Transcription initiation factor TFIID subunit 7 [Triticum urartu]